MSEATHPYESYFYNFSDWGDSPAPSLLKRHFPPGSAREQIFLHYHNLHPERADYLVDYLDSRLKNGVYDETDFVECFAKTEQGLALPPKGASHKKLEKIRADLERQLKEFEQLPEETSDQSQSVTWRYRRGEFDSIIAEFQQLRASVKPVGILGDDEERKMWGRWLTVIEIHFDRKEPDRAIALLDEYERARLAVQASPTPGYDVQLKSIGYLAQIDLETARNRVRFWWENTKVRSFDDLLKTHPDFLDIFLE